MHNSGLWREAFLDLDDNIRTSVDSASSYFSADEDHEFKLRIFNPESWMGDMKSVRERRQRFLNTTGFKDFISSPSLFSSSSEKPSGVNLPEQMEMMRLTEGNGAVLDSFSASDDGRQGDCLRDNGLPRILKKLDSEKLLAYQEFEKLLPCSVHKLMDREVSPVGEKQFIGSAARGKNRNWWRRILNRRHAVKTCIKDVSVINSQLCSMRTKVLRHRKRCGELTGLFIEQEIRAHEGSIRTMKFSPSGWYVASGGEDCIVRIWQIKEGETSCKCVVEDGSANTFGKDRSSSLIGMKGANRASIVFPKKAFKILEKPRHEFSGHSGEILDISWSSSNLLLTSSTDKTVRLWKVGCDGCLQVFLHNDYVTCIQFNPVDERYFISGSIDGKVRIWGVSDNQVIDWVDMRDIVTAVCYRPDGKGFVAGSINGNCRFYDYLGGNSMYLYKQFSVEGKQKSAGKRVTGLQFSPNDTQQIMITSADSRIRIFDESGVVHKFKGLRKTRSHVSASFTSNGRHIVSVGEDYNIYIWNYDFTRKPTVRKAKSIRSFEVFSSEGASVAVPWPKMDLLRTNNLFLLTPIKTLGSSAWFSNSECLFSRVGPAEELPLSVEASAHVDNGRIGKYQRDLNHHYEQLTSLTAMWSMGIITASSDGFIRSFRNYGLPVWS